VAEASLEHSLYLIVTGFGSGEFGCHINSGMKLACFEIETAPSLVLQLCFPIKLFQLAMGIYMLETNIFEFNF